VLRGDRAEKGKKRRKLKNEKTKIDKGNEDSAMMQSYFPFLLKRSSRGFAICQELE
jgi:hypothetical protein